MLCCPSANPLLALRFWLPDEGIPKGTNCDNTYTKGQGGEGPVKGSVPDRIKACLFEDLKLRKEEKEEEEKVYGGERLLIHGV